MSASVSFVERVFEVTNPATAVLATWRIRRRTIWIRRGPLLPGPRPSRGPRRSTYSEAGVGSVGVAPLSVSLHGDSVKIAKEYGYAVALDVHWVQAARPE